MKLEPSLNNRLREAVFLGKKSYISKENLRFQLNQNEKKNCHMLNTLQNNKKNCLNKNNSVCGVNCSYRSENIENSSVE